MEPEMSDKPKYKGILYAVFYKELRVSEWYFKKSSAEKQVSRGQYVKDNFGKRY